MSDPNRFDLESKSFQRASFVLAGLLCLFFVVFAAESIHWPWTNDSQVFHYAVFLMGRGLAPYRQIVDINLPGSYLSEWIGMHLAASTDLSYRLYDLLLLLAFTAASIVIAKPYHWFAGLFAGVMFALIHGSEGAWMLGERDLVMAVLLLWGYAFAFLAVRRRQPWWFLGAAILVALAATLKPFAVLYALALFPVAFQQFRRATNYGLPGTRRTVLAITAGFALVGVATLAFLLWRNSLPSFLHRSLALAAFYNGLHRTGLAYMLHHSTPRGLYFLIPPALYLAWRNRSWQDGQVLSLQIAILLGLASYFLQNRGFIYHRYPWTAFALLWIALEAALALRPWKATRTARRAFPTESASMPLRGTPARGTPARAVPARGTFDRIDRTTAAAIFLAGSLLIAPFYLSRVFTIPHGNQFALSIVDDMHHLAAAHPNLPLDGHVQCLDGIVGCYSALYRLGLEQSTGVMGDQLLFQTTVSPIVTQYRNSFFADITAAPPQVFIETNYWYGGPQRFEKTATWPAFDTWLHAHYTLYQQRTFPLHPSDVDPIGYQIYLRHD